MTDRYNGWANYPTWCVNLWLSNDHHLYLATQVLVEDAARDSDEDWSEDSGWTEAEARKFAVMDALKEFVLTGLVQEEYDKATMLADLISYALGEVDWGEIADAWLEDYVPEGVGA